MRRIFWKSLQFLQSNWRKIAILGKNPTLSSQFPEDQNQIHSSGHPSPSIAQKDSHESVTQFTIPKDISTIRDEKGGKRYLLTPKNWLPYNWSDVRANLLSQFLPHCCLNFKRRQLYPTKSQFIGKFWIYCSIAGCNLESNAVLLKSRQLIITNKYTRLKHLKGQVKSFRSRLIRGKEQLKSGESVANLSYPYKEFHKRLANLDDKSFRAGNLKDTSLSKKKLYEQCASDFRKSTFEDRDVIKSVQILKEKYDSSSTGKPIKGFIQFFSINPFSRSNVRRGWCRNVSSNVR